MNMKNGYQFIKRILPVLGLGLILLACETPESASLFDENHQPATPPTISSVSPDGEYFAGYQEIVITGQNFTSNTSNLFVYFNNVRAQILSASETQIVVRTPNLVADSIGIKVSVLGVEAFSNSWQYRLRALFRDVVQFPTNENPWAAAYDASGNYYVSYEASGAPAGVKSYNPDGTVRVESYAPAQSWFYRSAKVGPDGGLYLIRGGAVPFLYRVDAGGGVAASWGTGIGRTEDVTFDSNGNAWTGGTNENNAANSRINRINQARQVTRFDFNAQIYALAYFNNHIYVAGTRGTDSYLWRVELDANDVPGAEQEIANLTAAGALGRPTALAIAADGTAFVGMNDSRPMYQVSSGGQVTEMYPGIIPGQILKMEFMTGTQNLLMTILPATGNNRVITLNVQKDAP